MAAISRRPVKRPTVAPTIALIGLCASAALLALAPAAMPAGYSWMAHTTSESAAQGVQGAWVARLGFLLFGLSVLLLAAANRRHWGAAGSMLHGLFGILMVATATFSSRSWVEGAPFDATEDLLHSVTATGMGFAFAGGAVAVWIGDRHLCGFRRGVTLLAVTASVVLPLGMVRWPDIAGVLQRAMFAIAYLWFGTESIVAQRT
jgi:hypothetical protein